MTNAEARAQINALLNEAYAKINEAIKISDATGIEFSWNLAYGMGGTYTPKPVAMTKDEALRLVESGDALDYETRQKVVAALRGETSSDDDWYQSTEYGWSSSSSHC